MILRAACCLFLVVVAACMVRPPPAPPRETTLGLAISTTRLANGLRVVVVKDASATDVQVTTRFQVGAVDDGAHPGMAHFVEHLMFQQELAGQPLFAHLEDVATSFNAQTTYDATSYISRAPRAALGKLLAIEAARLELRCSTITDAAFANEREVVIAEIKQRDQVSEVFNAINLAVYPAGHPYQRMLGGTPDTLSAIDRATACAFVDARYAPGNAALVISGNVSDADVRCALAQLARIASRPAASPAHVPIPAITAHHVEVEAPVDEDVFVLAWQLPADPLLQIRVRAIASTLPRLIDAEIKGSVVALELGDQRAPMFAIAVLPGDDETYHHATDGTRRGIEALPAMFAANASRIDRVAFDRVKQSAIHNRYAALEDGSERDLRLAAYALSGGDPQTAIRAELDSLSGLTRDDGAQIAQRYLGSLRPIGVTLKASPGKRRGQRMTLRAPVHDMGPRRTPADPMLAQHPLDGAAGDELAGARTRVLANGLRVVLLPLTSVPTFDARLVFASGTANEPAWQRGVAMLAAHTLTWDLHYLEDLVAFAEAGGMRETDVGTDRTTFSVQGLDAKLDVVLAGLRRWVREGTYDDSAATFVSAMQRATKRIDDQGVVTDAWRAALFGANHPYVRAGIGRHTSTSLTLENASVFRDLHYTPDNATLVIAGRFDPALADRWVDFLFSDWKGTTVRRSPQALAPRPVSLARVDETALLQVRMAIPAGPTARATQLVAAEMLAGIVRDVRYRLGASYTFDASLAETRLANYYVIDGWIDTLRATAAVELVRDRLAALRGDATAAAQAFVIARGHVLTRLQAHVGSAGSLAARVEQDIAMARAPLSDLTAARAVRALRLDDMQATLAELELARATILINGPEAEVKAAFAALGRTPTYLPSAGPATDDESPGNTMPAFVAPEQQVLLSALQPAITAQLPPPLTWFVAPSIGRMSSGGVSAPSVYYGGYALAGGVAYRLKESFAVGGYAEIAHGTSDDVAGVDTTTMVPLNLAAMVQLGGAGRGFASGMLGLHADRLTGGGSDGWRTGGIYGVQLGYDLLRFGPYRIAIAGRYLGSIGATEFRLFALSLMFRR